jgi:hypothetical protein
MVHASAGRLARSGAGRSSWCAAGPGAAA